MLARPGKPSRLGAMVHSTVFLAGKQYVDYEHVIPSHARVDRSPVKENEIGRQRLLVENFPHESGGR
ncbi:hypothetical protein EVAR_95412_1 [Eumeta japonica]|uniref:Uncharacterized protein n=1 Tax=Eumeta variegata TaxID=151549 RepID=A0A4C1VJ08_EUMVA|nr:hypothetical protein EVAR_95412_1 [Eumeta japonica]